VLACGSNHQGQLGIGNKKGKNSSALQNNQDFSEIPIEIQGLENQVVTKIAAGQHSAAITTNGELFIWGSGVFG
jgi:alpha-tubulin suppressor-like RCC1 family protein